TTTAAAATTRSTARLRWSRGGVTWAISRPSSNGSPPTPSSGRVSRPRARRSSGTRSIGGGRSAAWRSSSVDGGAADRRGSVRGLRRQRRRPGLGDRGSRLRRPRSLHRRALSRVRLSLPATARARRASGRVLPRSLSAASGTVAAPAAEGLEGPPARRAVRLGSLRRGDGLPRPRARAGSGGRRASYARLADAERALDRGGPERGRARRDALRPRVVGSRASATSFALHPGDARAGDRKGGRTHRLDLASGEAAHLPLEPVGAPARSGLGPAREADGVAAGLRRVETRAGSAGSPRAPGATRGGDQDRRRPEAPDVA